MTKEIERKYILFSKPEGLDNGIKIDQGYLSEETRVRSKGGKFYLTEKIGHGLSREENEIEISKEVFEILWKCTKSRRISKTRYKVGRFEVDVFDEFVMAEIELNSEDEVVEFPPELVDIYKNEVTNDKRFENYNISSCTPIYRWDTKLKSTSWVSKGMHHELILRKHPGFFELFEERYDQGLDPGPMPTGYFQKMYTISDEEAENHFDEVYQALRHRVNLEDPTIVGWTIFRRYNDKNEEPSMKANKYALFLLYENGNVRYIEDVDIYRNGHWMKDYKSELETTIRGKFPELEEPDFKIRKGMKDTPFQLMSETHLQNLKKYFYE